jgi:hypothetical protein
MQTFYLPFTLNSKPTPSGREFSETSRVAHATRKGSDAGEPASLSVPRHWARDPVSTVQSRKTITAYDNWIQTN